MLCVFRAHFKPYHYVVAKTKSGMWVDDSYRAGLKGLLLNIGPMTILNLIKIFFFSSHLVTETKVTSLLDL